MLLSRWIFGFLDFYSVKYPQLHWIRPKSRKFCGLLTSRLVFRDDMTHKYLSVDTISTDFQERLECRNKSTTTFGFDFKCGHGRVPVKSERNHA